MRYRSIAMKMWSAALDLKLDPAARARNSANPRQSWSYTMSGRLDSLEIGRSTKALKIGDADATKPVD